MAVKNKQSLEFFVNITLFTLVPILMEGDIGEAHLWVLVMKHPKTKHSDLCSTSSTPFQLESIQAVKNFNFGLVFFCYNFGFAAV